MYVYLLRNIKNPDKYYVGVTSNLKKRFQAHNESKAEYTSRFGKWKMHLAIWFSRSDKAFLFEKYLKSHAGRNFSKNHF